MGLIKTRAAVTSEQNEIRTAGPPSERPSSGKIVDFGYQSICKNHSVTGRIDQILCWSSFLHKVSKTVQIPKRVPTFESKVIPILTKKRTLAFNSFESGFWYLFLNSNVPICFGL